LLLRNHTSAEADQASDHSHREGASSGEPHKTSKALRTRIFWMLWSAYLLGSLSFQTFLVHVVPFSVQRGLSAQQATDAIAIVGLGSVLGRVIVGKLSDSVGGMKSLALAYAILSVGVSVSAIVNSMPTLFLVSSIVGLAFGAFIATNIVATVDLFGIDCLGSLWGILAVAFGLSGAVGPLMAGLLYDTYNSYQGAFWVAAAVSLLAAIIVLRETRSNIAQRSLTTQP
jgi:MFS family permease